MATATKNKKKSPSSEVIYLGGYDAKSCPALVMKNHHPNYTEEDKDPIPAGDIARMESGVAFEPEVGARWAQELGDRFLAIPSCDRSDRSKKLREKLTLAALREPGDVQVIWNARLPKIKKSHQTGEPDALVRWGVDADGTHLWVPIDVKHHKSLQGTARNGGTSASSFGDPHPDDAALADIGVGIGRQEDAFQLAHYYRMLQHLGHAAPVALGGIVGKELMIVWHQLDAQLYGRPKASALELYDAEFASRLQIATAALNGETLVEPEWKSECTSCVWRTSCHDELKVDLDHITLVPGITPNRARAHYAQGVRRIADLARFDWQTATLIDSGIDVLALRAWAASVPAETSVLNAPVPNINKALEKGSFPRAKVMTAGDVMSLCSDTLKYVGSGVHDLAGSIDRARANKIGKVFLGRGINSVGINRSVYEQDMDIEDDNGYVYLIGVRTTGRKMDSGRTSTERRRGEGRFEYDAFVNWDKSEDGEARVFAEFWAHVQKSREYAKARKYAYRMYYYTDHEPSAFKRLAQRHAGKPGVPTVEDVEEFFKLREVIDLYAVLVEQLVWPTESVKLKEVAKWVRFSWRDSDPSGDNSLAWYRDAVDHEDEKVREENRQRLLEYNEDDVTAQVAVRDWLTRLGEARHPGKKLPNVATLDRRFLRR